MKTGMTVAALIQYLQTVDPSWRVVMSKDAEGNDYSPLRIVEAAHYEEESTWSGTVLDEDEDGGEPVVCLWPVN
jgi:hypothetical protein